ncbi:MAG: PAS domain-containing protein [Algibacter sp.]|uniref:PAS domain-containing protein n=1 Tax=Algibacter sp. TaxID=1872428 RepID=UPI0032987047
MQAIKNYKWRTNPDIAILEFIKDNVAVSVSDKLGRIIYANDCFCAKIECKENELLGVVNSIFLSKINENSFYKNLWNRLENGCVWQGALNYKTKTQKLIRFETTIVPLKDTKGNVESFVFMYLDEVKVNQECYEPSM